MRRLPSFVVGQVLGALIIGAVAGSFLDLAAILTFGTGMALGAAASALACKWWPGYDAAGWRLWLAGSLANPLLLVALGFAVQDYECLLGRRAGWSCMFANIGPTVAGICLIPPLLGIGLRRLRRGPRGGRLTPRSPG